MSDLIRLVETATLREGRDAPLYHMTDRRKATHVLMTDRMDANWSHKLPTHSDQNSMTNTTGNSFTRDPRYAFRPGDYIVRFTFDQARLSRSNRIEPVDADYVHRHTKNARSVIPDDISGVRSRASAVNASEEFVVGPIKAVHLSLQAIELTGLKHEDDDMAWLIEIIRAYAAAWPVSVTIAPEVQSWFERHVANPDYFTHYQIIERFPHYEPVRRPPSVESTPKKARRKTAKPK